MTRVLGLTYDAVRQKVLRKIVTKNKKLELNWLSGSIVDLCKKNDIECKVHYEIFGGINQEIR